jgi:hypothetical protein
VEEEMECGVEILDRGELAWLPVGKRVIDAVYLCIAFTVAALGKWAVILGGLNDVRFPQIGNSNDAA